MVLMFYILLMCVVDLFPNKIVKKSYDGRNYIRKIAMPSNRVNKVSHYELQARFISDVKL